MNRLCDKVLTRIKYEKIEPRPRWYFLLKNYCIWIMFAISVTVGALALCVILDVLFDSDWDVYLIAIDNPLERILLSLPLVWILVLGVFLGVAYYNCKSTKCGYRRETYFIIGFSIAGSVVLGLLFHFYLGMGERMESMVADNLPFYKKIYDRCNNREIWLHPEKGLLGGEIVRISPADGFDLRDFEGDLWVVRKERNTEVRGDGQLFERESVRIIGEEEGGHVFRAFEIRPWKNKCPAGQTSR